MADEINFLDLAVLLKITPNTPLEKLGGLINASIFDASNLAGGLKQKGLVEFTAYYPGPNSMTVTDAGKALIAEADARSMEPTDPLDDSILVQISGGKRIPLELQNTLNIRSRDLALRLYKENKQGLLTYELKNGMVELMLTESGFLHAKGGAPQAPKPAAPAAATIMAGPSAAQPQPTVQPVPSPAQPAAATTAAVPPAAPQAVTLKPKKSHKMLIITVVVLIILAVVVAGRLVLHLY